MKTNRRIRNIIGVYSMIWILSIATFWVFCRDPQMAMLHIIVVQYILLPIVTLIISILIGKECSSKKHIWLVPICFTAAYLLSRLLTQSLLQQILAGVAAFPGIFDFLVIIAISSVGLLFGWGLRKMRGKAE